MKEKEYNKHHIVPSSQKGSSRKQNLVRLDKRVHIALHLIFNNMTPPEQIERLIGINSTALTEEVKSDIIKILDVKEMEYWYNKGVLK